MIPRRQERSRVKLDPESYSRLRNKILDRDGWRCQHCGSMKNLEVHHVQSRANLGNDEEGNLITLCADCHGMLHQHTLPSKREGP